MAKVGGYWQETFLVSLTKKSTPATTPVEFAAKCEDVKFGGGARGITTKTLINGGCLKQFNPMEIWSVTMTIYPIEVTALDEWFWGDTSAQAQPMQIKNELSHTEIQAIVTWCDGTLATAGGATPATTAAYRIVAKNGFITNMAYDPSGKEFKVEITIEFPPYTAAAVGNLTHDSTTSASNLSVVADYT